MEFRTEVNIEPSAERISYEDRILMAGSCFTENIGEILKELRFPIIVNPFGVNYNPSSLARNLWTLLQGRQYKADELQEHDGKWFSFDHHSRFSNPDRDACLENINVKILEAHEHLRSSRFLILTWGTAWVYVNKRTKNVVSNNHKLPDREFSRHQLSVNQVVDTYSKLFAALRQQVPHLKIILTVSPVRHWKDGPVKNSVSKSSLILAADRLCGMFSYCEYFPAYEIAMDDLRDYRFYADDLLHPNKQMISYIWEKFSAAYIEDASLELSTEIRKLVSARNHRPFDPSSERYREFCRKQLENIRDLKRAQPELELSDLQEYFSKSMDGS